MTEKFLKSIFNWKKGNTPAGRNTKGTESQSKKCQDWGGQQLWEADGDSANDLVNAGFQRGFPGAQMVKNLPAMQEAQVQSLGWEEPLEQEMASHSNTFAWRIPWTEDTGGLQSMGLQGVGCDWAYTNTHTHTHTHTYTQTHSDTAGNLKPRNCHGPGPVLSPGHQEDVAIKLCYPGSMGQAQTKMSLTAASL